MLIFSIQGFAQIEKSEYLLNSTTSSSGSTSELILDGNNVIVQQSIGQSSPIGVALTSKAEVLQGFIQPSILSKILTPNVPQILKASFFPNPFVNNLYLELDEIPSSNVTITAFDITRTVVYSESLPSNNRIKLEPIQLKTDITSSLNATACNALKNSKNTLMRNYKFLIFALFLSSTLSAQQIYSEIANSTTNFEF